MSITEKLGKMGIPGFRSGKKWKMVIAIFGYFWIFMVLLAIISPSSDNSIQRADKENPVVPTQTKKPVDTKKPVETKRTANINQEDIDALMSALKADENVYDATIIIEEDRRTASIAVIVNTKDKEEVERVYTLTKSYMLKELKMSGIDSVLIGIYTLKKEKLKLKSEYLI